MEGDSVSSLLLESHATTLEGAQSPTSRGHAWPPCSYMNRDGVGEDVQLHCSSTLLQDPAPGSRLPKSVPAPAND